MKNKILSKEDIKTILILTFSIVEILSMIFNSFFVQINIGDYYFTLNYSVVFFCIAFFIVDIMNDFFSSREADKFFYYKIYSQFLFLSLSYSAIHVYGLENTMFSKMVNETPWAMLSGLIATYFSFKLMGKIMSKFKVRSYQGRSVFLRYLCSTLPSEITFSLIFSILSFSQGREFSEVIHIFTISSMVKIILSILFSLAMVFLLKVKIFQSSGNSIYPAEVDYLLK